jgi:hypothetical protein
MGLLRNSARHIFHWRFGNERARSRQATADAIASGQDRERMTRRNEYARRKILARRGSSRDREIQMGLARKRVKFRGTELETA